MSLVVIYEGQRKVIKIPSPNSLVQALLAEAAGQFNVDVTKVAFKHKRTTLDNAQPIRFANLSNNAQVDLITVATTNSLSAKNQSCKIALAIEGADNTTETFDASISLFEMLNQLASSNKVPVDVQDRSPEIVYLRAKYTGLEALTSTTFTSLGLAGQSARLQLRFNSTASSSNSAAPSPRTPPPVTVATSSTAMEVDAPPLQEHSSAMEVVAEEPALQTLPPLPSAPPAVVTVDLDQLSTTSIHTTNSDSTLLTASPIPPSTNNINTNSNNTSANITTHTTTHITATLPSPSTTAQALLAENFDRVSIPAVLTLSKYILNILLNPGEVKYRRVNTDNKVYTTKVAVARGAREFLCSAGFVVENGVYVLNPSNTNDPNNTTTSSAGINNTTLSAAQLTLLTTAYTALHTAMTELEIPVEEQPYNGSSIHTILTTQERQNKEVQQRGAEAVVQFDPYKSHIVRTAPQPIRQKQAESPDATTTPTQSALTLSSTELQLQELARKRAVLEGRPEDVERLTEVLLPRADGTLPPLTTPDTTDTTSTTTTTSNTTEGVPRSVLSKILAKRNSDGSDDTPLTTQAVRDLQRAQKERVYNRTMVRVKFPDRSCLQGYFHPRHTLHDVYSWVESSLSEKYNSNSNSAGGGSYGLWSFELYLSPPRTVLVPHTTTSSSTVNSNTSSTNTTSDIPTLSSLRLVPAALIYLAWKSNGKSSSGVSSSSGTEVGACFRPELIVNAGAEGSGGYAFPTGTALAPPPLSTSEGSVGSNSGKLSGVKSTDQSGASGGEVKRMIKPKWFK